MANKDHWVADVAVVADFVRFVAGLRLIQGLSVENDDTQNRRLTAIRA